MRLRSVLLSTMLATANSFAQTENAKEVQYPQALKSEAAKIEPYAQMQGWGVYSMGREAQVDADPQLDDVEQRANFFFRRARLGFRSKPYKDLSYVVSLYYDNAGHDSLASTRAGTLPGTSSGKANAVTKSVASVGLWDTFLTWKVSQSDLVHITGGYFRPQISRESITAAFNVNSFEKAISQSYVRQAVIGRGYGRGSGINVGGLSNGEKGGINYNVGVFNKVTTEDSFTNSNGDPVELGETQGTENSLVYVGRLALTYGDPEMAKYGLGYNINYFGKRNGITVAVNGSLQDETPSYRANNVIGGDILANYGSWNIDGEFFFIYLKNNGAENYSRARTGHLRVGHNFYLSNGTVLEPSAMVSSYYGEGDSDHTGRDTVVDVGVNWYLDQNRYKFYMHYVKQDGAGDNLVHRDGAYHYGDYAGVGLTLQI